MCWLLFPLALAVSGLDDAIHIGFANEESANAFSNLTIHSSRDQLLSSEVREGRFIRDHDVLAVEKDIEGAGANQVVILSHVTIDGEVFDPFISQDFEGSKRGRIINPVVFIMRKDFNQTHIVERRIFIPEFEHLKWEEGVEEFFVSWMLFVEKDGNMGVHCDPFNL